MGSSSAVEHAAVNRAVGGSIPPLPASTKSSGEERAKLKGLTIRMQCFTSSQSDRIASGARAGVTGRGLGDSLSGLPLEAWGTRAFKSFGD